MCVSLLHLFKGPVPIVPWKKKKTLAPRTPELANPGNAMSSLDVALVCVCVCVWGIKFRRLAWNSLDGDVTILPERPETQCICFKPHPPKRRNSSHKRLKKQGRPVCTSVTGQETNLRFLCTGLLSMSYLDKERRTKKPEFNSSAFQLLTVS